jgi:cell division protein FtsB
MVTCCEIAITLALTNLLSLAVFAGYTIKVRQSQINLEKKNGAEQHQIEKLQQELNELKQQLPPLSNQKTTP